VSSVALRAIGVVTRGRDAAALPRDGGPAADRGAVITAQPTPRRDDRMRRATRECLLAVDAVDAALVDGDLRREAIAGPDTALVFVTAAAYAASNRAFVEGGGGALHFPYTAPSAVPAEVAIEFGLHGPSAVLIGGAAATIDAIEHARVLLERGACARVIVLAVETFSACADVLARGGITQDGPWVEAAVAALLEPAPPAPGGHGDRGARREAAICGESLACAPLIELANAERGRVVELRGRWRGRVAITTVRVA
jgi:hypothetical protein